MKYNLFINLTCSEIYQKLFLVEQYQYHMFLEQRKLNQDLTENLFINFPCSEIYHKLVLWNLTEILKVWIFCEISNKCYIFCGEIPGYNTCVYIKKFHPQNRVNWSSAG